MVGKTTLTSAYKPQLIAQMHPEQVRRHREENNPWSTLNDYATKITPVKGSKQTKEQKVSSFIKREREDINENKPEKEESKVFKVNSSLFAWETQCES